VNNLPKVVAQQRRGRASNLRLLDRKSDALPLGHHATYPPYTALNRITHNLKKLKRLALEEQHVNNTTELEVHSVERMYLRQSCSHSSR